MSQSLPERPNLEHLKTQARELLDAFQRQDPEAQARLERYFGPRADLGLAEAQLTLAREYGFESWARLKAHVEAAQAGDTRLARADRLVECAKTRDLLQAQALLARDPDLGHTHLAAACITGESATVQALLGDVNAKVPPLDWEPLLMVCWSPLLRRGEFRPKLVSLAEWLLDQGANPNAYWPDPQWDNEHETCLYGATGVNDCPDLARLLLERGADPNDNESLYHSMELATPECMEALLQAGSDPLGHNALFKMADHGHASWPPVILKYIPDRSKIPATFLRHALRRGATLAFLRPFIASGMQLDTPGPDGLTAYRDALRMGRMDVVEALAAAGASRDHEPYEAALAALQTGGSAEPGVFTPEVIAALEAEPLPLMVMYGERGLSRALEALLKAGMDPNLRDSSGCTALHQAALHGQLETIRLLLSFGADPNLKDGMYSGNAIGWACHASEHLKAGHAPEVFVECVKALVEAGAEPPAQAWGSREVRAYLESLA